MRESESCSVISNSLQPHELYSTWNSPGQKAGVSSPSLLQEIFPTQGSNPGLPHCRRILDQLSHKRSPRILDWVAYSFSRGSSRPRNRTGVSCIASGFSTIYISVKSKITGVGSLFLLQGIFLTKESNQGLLHCRQSLYQLHDQGSPTPK